MQSPLKAAIAAAAIAGAGLAGFGFSAAIAQTDDGATPPDTTEAVPDETGRPPGGPGCEGHGGPGLDSMAEAIGIEVEDLRTALMDGQTPAEVAEANGMSRADLVDAIVADINEHLDQAVEDGHLTEAEADERRAEIEDHANSIVDGERPERPAGFGPGGPGGPPFGDEEAPADGPDA